MENQSEVLEAWESAIDKSSDLLRHGLEQMVHTFKTTINTMDKQIHENMEVIIENFDDRLQRMEQAIRGFEERALQKEADAQRVTEERMEKKMEEIIKHLEERIQKKMEDDILDFQEKTQKKMMDTLRIVQGGIRYQIKEEVRALEEETQKKMEESVRSMEISMPEKVEQTIRDNDERMSRMENLVRGRERRAHELLQRIEERFVTSERRSPIDTKSSSSEEPNTGTKKATDDMEDRMTKLEAFVQTSVGTMFTRVESLLTQVERRPRQENIQRACPETSSASSPSGSRPSPSDNVDVDEALREAARKGEINNVRAALVAGANVDGHSPNGLTALHWASREGHAEVVTLLLDRGANVNKIDDHGWTALHSAIEKNRLKCVNLLIPGGADLDIHDEYGWTPLHVAANCGHEIAVRALVDAGANTAAKNSGGETPLNVACKAGTRQLLRRCLRTESVDQTERTARRFFPRATRREENRTRGGGAPDSVGRRPRGNHMLASGYPRRGRRQTSNFFGNSRPFSSSTESFQDEGLSFQDDILDQKFEYDF